MSPLALLGLGLLAVALIAGALHAALLAFAGRQRRAFLAALGPVVRIATPCRIVKGAALVPGTVGLTPLGLRWEALDGSAGATSFEGVKRLETDARLASGRRLLFGEALRVTLDSGEALELVVSRGHAWEWRRALGEWVGARGGPPASLG